MSPPQIYCGESTPMMKLHVCLSVSIYRIKTTDSVSNPALGLLDIYITSPSGHWSVTAGQTFVFTCFVECTPSCTYTWTFEGKTYENDQVHIPVFHKGEKPMIKEEQKITVTQTHRTEPLTCQAKNTVSGATISTTQILTIYSKSLKSTQYTMHLWGPCHHLIVRIRQSLTTKRRMFLHFVALLEFI